MELVSADIPTFSLILSHFSFSLLTTQFLHLIGFSLHNRHYSDMLTFAALCMTYFPIIVVFDS